MTSTATDRFARRLENVERQLRDLEAQTRKMGFTSQAAASALTRLREERAEIERRIGDVA